MDVTLSDVSEKALEVCNINIKNLDSNSKSIELDLNSKIQHNKKYDLIVSNPPYVRNLEKKKMQNNVLNFEPELALFVEDDDPLVFYRAILKFAHNTLAVSYTHLTLPTKA
mgnify:CR=1 FL=1